MTGSLTDVTKRVTVEVERLKIEETLREAEGNKGRAAELLQVSYKSLVSKLGNIGWSSAEPVVNGQLSMSGNRPGSRAFEPASRASSPFTDHWPLTTYRLQPNPHQRLVPAPPASRR